MKACSAAEGQERWLRRWLRRGHLGVFYNSLDERRQSHFFEVPCCSIIRSPACHTQRHMDTGRMPCEDCSDFATKSANCKKLGKRPGTHSSLVPSERTWPCRHLDLELLASRTLRQKISVVEASQLVVLCYGHP